MELRSGLIEESLHPSEPIRMHAEYFPSTPPRVPTEALTGKRPRDLTLQLLWLCRRGCLVRQKSQMPAALMHPRETHQSCKGSFRSTYRPAATEEKARIQSPQNRIVLSHHYSSYRIGSRSCQWSDRPLGFDRHQGFGKVMDQALGPKPARL